MFKKTKVCTGVLMALSSVLMVNGGLAVAQTTDRVEITGSAIKRVATEGALPVQTFTQEDIQRSGVTTVTDFIQQLPVMQGFTVAADSVGGGGGGITTASIHDVGEVYTLVLLNGRRIAPATSGSTIDLNSIPLAAVERVEVLTDGAGALYGADAIAGVVNFVLKKGAAPFTITARLNKPQEKGGESSNFALSKGFGDLETDGFSVFAAVGLDKQKQLKAKDRDFAKTGIISFTDQQGRQLSFFNGSSRSVPPNVDVRYLNPSATDPNRISTVSFSPYFVANAKCPPAHVDIGRQCFFDYTSSVEIFPEQERKSVFGTAEVKLGSTGLNLFADLAFTDASIIARIAPYPAEFSVPLGDPLYTKYMAPNLTQAQRDNIRSINVKYRLYDIGNRGYDYNTKATHVVGGLRGSIAGFDVDAALTLSKQKQDQNYVSGFPLADKFNKALLVDRSIDPFPYALGEMPAGMLSALAATQYVGNYNTTDIKMTGFDARASRDLFKMGGGSAAMAFGVDARKNSYKVTANPAVANAEILFDDPQPEYDLSRSSAGAFAEMSLPVIKGLDLTLGARYDTIGSTEDALDGGKKYGDTQSATTFKLSGKFVPIKSMLVRGSIGSGFRVASMQQIAQPIVDFGVTGGSYVCPFTAAYDPLGYVAASHICPDTPGQFEVFQGGNAKLKPEKSKQWTLGAVFDPIDSLSIGLDLWSVEVKDAVTEVSERLILSQPAKYISLYSTKFKSSNNSTYVAINLLPINIGRSESQGLDWDLKFRTSTAIGKLTTRLAGTYLIKSRYTTPGTDDQWETSMNRFGSNDQVSFRNVFTAQARLDTDAWTHSLTVNYRNGYKDIFHDEENCAVDDGVDCIATQLDVKAHTTLDWQTQWRINKMIELTAGVQNLADTKPPLSLRNTGSHQLGYDPRYASPMGRTFYVQGTVKF